MSAARRLVALATAFVGVLVCLLPVTAEAQERSAPGNASFFAVVWGPHGQDGSDRGGARESDRPAGTTRDRAADFANGDVIPMSMAVDVRSGTGTVSNVNGVLEAGEFVTVDPGWLNYTNYTSFDAPGSLSDFTGPAGGTYSLLDSSANYTLPQMVPTHCNDGSPDACYTISVSGTRPSTHWDAIVNENLAVPAAGGVMSWTIHIGESFADVPTINPFYRSIETVLHRRITGGCFGGSYCPADPVTRAQMAVFLLKSKFGSAHIPPFCTGSVFTDVPCTGSPFDPWVEELGALGITSGCGGSLYCTGDSVTRQQLAVFLLKTLEGSAYVPPACTAQFDDVPCPSQFADWIGDLYSRGITSGCSAAPALYCPTSPNTRGQMAAFLVKTFGLLLYGT